MDKNKDVQNKSLEWNPHREHKRGRPFDNWRRTVEKVLTAVGRTKGQVGD